MEAISRQSVLLLCLLLPAATALAQSRGGGCTGFLCDLTAVGILLVVAGLLIASVTASMKKNGLVKGFFGHSGVQLLLGYMAMLAIVVGLGFGALALLGKV